MLQVKFLEDENEEELELMVNEFLEEIEDKQVMSIQYRSNLVAYEDGIESSYSVFIAYALES
ncbi:MAG: sporulation protein Cse60 [Erysipelotrichaceae bacterium]|nr:sporulation protein Cse60 [Erysipelotrichaceae bacterium]